MNENRKHIALRLLRWFCDPMIVDDIEGDLHERYERHYVHRRSPNLLLARDVLFLFRPGIIRSFYGTHFRNHFSLLSHYLRVGFRNTMRADNFSIVNILGLSLALSSTLLIYQYVDQEYQTDSFFSRKDQLYRLVRQVEDAQSSYRSPTLAAPYKDVFVNTHGVASENLVRVYQDDELVTAGKKSFFEPQFYYADPTFFQLLDFPFLHGDPETALQSPNAVVISEEVASKYFGTDNALGKFMDIDNKGLLEVSGVLADLPTKSHLVIDFIAPLDAMGYTSKMLPLSEAHSFMYYLLASEKELPRDLPGLDPTNTIIWQTLQEIYFDQNLEMDMATHGNEDLLNILVLVAIVILIIAGANFVNLSLCTFLKKIKHLGIRKALGSNTILEVFKHLIENYLIICIAIGLSLVISYLLSITLLQQYITTFYLETHALLWLPVAALVLALPFTLYVATIISTTQASSALARKFKQVKISRLQEGILTFQFTVVIVLMVLSLLITKQFNFLQRRELGLNPDQILYFLSNNKHSFRNSNKILTELEKLSGVQGVAMSTGGLPLSETESTAFRIQGLDDQKQLMTVFASPNFPSMMEMELLEGRLFNPLLQSVNNRTALLNETAARQMGWPQQILIGKSMTPLDYLGLQEGQNWKIVGIIQDFHYESLQFSVQPLVILNSDQEESFVVRLSSTHSLETVRHIASIWETHVPKYPFVCHFLDEQFQHMHKEATQQRKMLYLFLGLVVAIAIFGTLGLSTYMLQLKRKEIALRNLLGAPFKQLLILLTSRYVKILMIASVLGVPISFYFSNLWLSEFSYRVDLSADLFFGSIGSIVFVILGVLSVQIRRSTLYNPVNELSDE